MVTENLKEVEQKIVEACMKSGRNRNDITLIAVSKTKPIELMEEAISCGIHIFGENKVQEIVNKHEILGDSGSFHMIGHLQRNKVKPLVGKTVMIHSVDSFRLANQIDLEFGKQNRIADVLIEVNVAKEPSKFGVLPEDTEELLREISQLMHIRVKGLMTIAPYTDDSEKNRKYFRSLKKLLVDMNSKNIDNISMGELSMGMSGDYQVAIEEGATFIRVGTGIFGTRQYNI